MATTKEKAVDDNSPAGWQVLRDVQHRLEKCPYTFVFCDVTAEFEDGLLTMRGRVSSFYLKQMLQEIVRGIDQVAKFDNDVDVVCANGLSSVRPQIPR